MIVSCNSKSKGDAANHFESPHGNNSISTNITFSNNIDSISITCLMFGKGSDQSFSIDIIKKDQTILIYKNNNLLNLDSTTIKNEIINLINILYLDKTTSIEISKVKIDGIVTDYPTIIVETFIKGKSISREVNQIGSENYKLEFSQKFIEFYKLLDLL